MVCPRNSFFACALLMILPAPWQALPKEMSIASFAPHSMKDGVPILPGIKTGCPTSLYTAGTSGCPGGNALVAPFLCTYTSFFLPSTVCSVSYTHLRAHETPEHLVCRLLLEKKKH